MPWYDNSEALENRVILLEDEVEIIEELKKRL
jgi:hypothetical protein